MKQIVFDFSNSVVVCLWITVVWYHLLTKQTNQHKTNVINNIGNIDRIEIESPRAQSLLFVDVCLDLPTLRNRLASFATQQQQQQQPSSSSSSSAVEQIATALGLVVDRGTQNIDRAKSRFYLARFFRSKIVNVRCIAAELTTDDVSISLNDNNNDSIIIRRFVSMLAFTVRSRVRPLHSRQNLSIKFSL